MSKKFEDLSDFIRNQNLGLGIVKQIVLAFVNPLLILLIISCSGPPPATPTPIPAPTPVPDIKVHSEEISKDYSDRKSTAERIYQGKLAEIQGRIVHIKYDEQASLFEIDLNGAGRFTGNVVCKVKHAELQPDPEKLTQ